MDPEYKKYLDSCGIKKNHIIKIVVREVSSEIPQKRWNFVVVKQK